MPRLLRYRTGHHACPTLMSYFDETGHFILSASRDQSLRNVSVFKDGQSSELSQGAGFKKLATELSVQEAAFKHPIITHMSFSLTRRKDWDCILTCHLNQTYALTWHYEDLRLGSHTLQSRDKSLIKTVLVSPCGHFGLLGCQSGSIDVFNMQSGIFQHSLKGSHQDTPCVTGLALSAGNRTLVSTHMSGLVCFWDYGRRAIVYTTRFPAAISKLVVHAESDLMAIVCDDHVIRIMDMDTQQLVRQFDSHTHAITSVAFSRDGKWLVSSSMDQTIRVWDLPNATCIDTFVCKSIPVHVCLSPTGDALAIAQTNCIGIQIM